MAIQISGTTVIDSSRNITNVESYSGNGVATQAEAEAGTNNDQLMTPLRVKQAIEAMSGSSLPDIQSEGWVGTDKGHKGFGWSCSYMTSGGPQQRSYNAASFPHNVGTPGSDEVQDLICRRTNAWDDNRGKTGGSTYMEPCGMSFFQGTYSQYTQANLITPGSMEGLTLDIYWGQGRNYTSGYTASAVGNISYFPIAQGNSRSNSYLTATNTTIHTGSNDKEVIVRARLSNLPDTCGIRLAGSTWSALNTTIPTICYYEIY